MKGLGSYCRKWNKQGSEYISLLIDIKDAQSEKQRIRDSYEKLERKRNGSVGERCKDEFSQVNKRWVSEASLIQSWNETWHIPTWNGKQRTISNGRKQSELHFQKVTSPVTYWRHSHEHDCNMGGMSESLSWSIKKMTAVQPSNSEALAGCLPILWWLRIK